MTKERDDLRIRDARKSDVAAIHAIEASSFPAPWKPEFFGHEIGVAARLNLVAVRGKIVVGYVFAMWVLDEMHINKIAVIESERRRGIADELMKRCVAVAIEERMADITLEVRESNHPARAFYERIGFSSVYVRPRYYPDGESAVVMALSVATATEPATTPPG